MGHMPEPRDSTYFQCDRMVELLGALYPDAESIADAMSFALCDLRHLADQEGLAFGLWDRRGYRFYIAERGDEDRQKRKAALEGSEADQGERS